MVSNDIGCSVHCGLGWKKLFGSLLLLIRGIIESSSWIVAMETKRMRFTKRQGNAL